MKKMLFTLMLFVFSFFTISSVQASSAPAEKAPITQSIAKAKFGGHWEIWCVYNEKTGEFELICVWVEDDTEK